jgi:transposase InsO family protein
VESIADSNMDLRDTIQRIALEWSSYGRRRVTQELHRRGWPVNGKRVYRLMSEDNLLCGRQRKFVVTADSNHGRKVYPNLARPTLLYRYGPALGSRHHVYSAADGVRLSGRDSGRLLAAGYLLGARPDTGR